VIHFISDNAWIPGEKAEAQVYIFVLLLLKKEPAGPVEVTGIT
jgi:hypothetical protein